MSQFIRTRLRCAVYPGKVGTNFQVVQTGATPQIYKDTGIQFEIAFFDLGDVLFDVSNVAAVKVMVKPDNNPGAAAEMLKIVDVNSINQNLTLADWQSGVSQHCVVTFLASETGISAGNHDLTVWGNTTDNTLDADIFGMSKLTVIDRGLSNVVNPPVGSSPGVDLVTLNALLQNYITAILPAGQTITFVSKDGLTKRIIGIDNLKTRIDDLEDNT